MNLQHGKCETGVIVYYLPEIQIRLSFRDNHYLVSVLFRLKSPARLISELDAQSPDRIDRDDEITEHAVHFNGLTINDELFTSLTPDLQADIQAAAREAAAERTEALRVENEELLATMESEGAIVTTDVDKQAFIDAAQPLYEDFIANHNASAYVEQIQALAE